MNSASDAFRPKIRADNFLAGGAMKNNLLITLATVLLVSSALFAQENSATSKQADAGVTSTKPLIVSGKVSNDGRMLLTDIDSEWTVANSESVKGFEGRMVKVKCFVDTEKSRIHVLSVKKDEQNFSYTARQTDSAFRR